MCAYSYILYASSPHPPPLISVGVLGLPIRLENVGYIAKVFEDMSEHAFDPEANEPVALLLAIYTAPIIARWAKFRELLRHLDDANPTVKFLDVR